MIELSDVVAQRFGYKMGRKRKAILLNAIEIHRLMADQTLTGRDVQQIAEMIPTAVLADALGTSPSNIGKVYDRDSLRKPQVSQLVDMSKTYSRIREFFDDDPSLVQEFLTSPTPALDGECPATLLADSAGRDAVEAMVDKMAYGDLS